MYKATITNKTITNGKLSVTVAFSDDTDQTFFDVFETTQMQNDRWIGEQIKRRLGHLNSLYDLAESITIGHFDEQPPVKSETEIYREKAIQYIKYMDIARMGLIQSDREVIQTLRKWLREKFKDEYLTLF